MLKEAIEKIAEMAAKPQQLEIDGRHFIVSGDGTNYMEMHPDVLRPDCISLHSLDAVVKMVRAEALPNNTTGAPIYIEVKSHDQVEVFLSPLDEAHRCERPYLYECKAQDVPGWEPETQMPFEKAAVALQTRFQDGGDKEYTIQLLSQITTGAKVTYNDIGIATTIVSQKGVTLQQNSTIRPVVRLRPYRTFQEVPQPEGLFLIRINERGITFIEADGGMWKLTARKTVADYLTEALATEIEAGTVIVML